jgi:hypothetical protein
LRTPAAAPPERHLLNDVLPSTALLTAAPAPAAAGLTSLKQLPQKQQQHSSYGMQYVLCTMHEPSHLLRLASCS